MLNSPCNNLILSFASTSICLTVQICLWNHSACVLNILAEVIMDMLASRAAMYALSLVIAREGICKFFHLIKLIIYLWMILKSMFSWCNLLFSSILHRAEAIKKANGTLFSEEVVYFNCIIHFMCSSMPMHVMSSNSGFESSIFVHLNFLCPLCLYAETLQVACSAPYGTRLLAYQPYSSSRC